MPDATRLWLGAHLRLVYLFLYLPIAVLMVLSFNRAGLPTVWSGFSVQWYGALLDSKPILNAAANTLIVALFSLLVMRGLDPRIHCRTRRARTASVAPAARHNGSPDQVGR